MTGAWSQKRGPSLPGGLVRLARPLQLAIWTGSTVVLGLSAAFRFRPDWFLALVVVAVGGVALQGYITHGLNDLYDWQSGTDQTTPGRISGGSHVIRDGLLDGRRIGVTVAVASAAYVGLLLWIGVWRTEVLWPLGIIALGASIFYSLPPLRFCYRPLAGEWLGIFPAMTAGVLAAGLAVQQVLTPVLWVTAVLQGIICVASVMQHHLVDIDSDWGAHPPKRTSPAYWQRRVGRPGSEVAMFYLALAFVVSLAAAVLVAPRFLWSAALCVVGVFLASRTQQGDQENETRSDYGLKFLGAVNALGYVAIAVLVGWH
jgi:1,4-dihydroxy-2-naphthoate octaprenyltransferase